MTKIIKIITSTIIIITAIIKTATKIATKQ